jgi:hypothetical protein
MAGGGVGQAARPTDTYKEADCYHAVGIGSQLYITETSGNLKEKLFRSDFYLESYGGAFLPFDINFGEIGDENDVHAVTLKVNARDSQSFNGLVNRARADGLNFCPLVFPDHSGNCAGDRCRA